VKEEPQVRPRRKKFYSTVSEGDAFLVALGQSKTFRVVVFPSKAQEDEDDVPAHDVTMIQIGSLRLSLTALTEDELRAFWEGIRLAVFHALPTVRMLDKDAQDAYETGAPTRRRFYRRPPVVALKRGLFAGLAEGIHERFDRVVDLDRTGRGNPDATGLAASGRSRLAIPERGPQELGSSDSEPEAGSDEDLGEG
jgi:hypothetical protein